MSKKSMLILIVCFLAIVAVFAAVFIHMQRVKSQPRLIQICQLKDVVNKCPEVSAWIKTRNPWEWLPDSFVSRLISESLHEEEIVFATYEMEITAFKPYSFNATKGEFKISKGAAGCIYIYAWDKRYRPMVSP